MASVPGSLSVSPGTRTIFRLFAENLTGLPRFSILRRAETFRPFPSLPPVQRLFNYTFAGIVFKPRDNNIRIPIFRSSFSSSLSFCLAITLISGVGTNIDVNFHSGFFTWHAASFSVNYFFEEFHDQTNLVNCEFLILLQ